MNLKDSVILVSVAVACLWLGYTYRGCQSPTAPVPPRDSTFTVHHESTHTVPPINIVHGTPPIPTIPVAGRDSVVDSTTTECPTHLAFTDTVTAEGDTVIATWLSPGEIGEAEFLSLEVRKLPVKSTADTVHHYHTEYIEEDVDELKIFLIGAGVTGITIGVFDLLDGD